MQVSCIKCRFLILGEKWVKANSDADFLETVSVVATGSLAAPGAQEGAREAGAPRGPPSPESSCTHFSFVPKTQVTFVPLPFLGRVFDFLARDRKASLLCCSAPLVRQWRGGHPGVNEPSTCGGLAATLTS